MSSLIGAQSVYNQLGWGTNEMLGYSNPCLLANGDFLLIADSYLGSNGDKTTENFGMNDLWITRFNSINEVLWQKSFGGSLDDDRGTVKELTNGDLIVTSRSNSQISGNKTVDSKGGFDFWVASLGFIPRNIASISVSGNLTLSGSISAVNNITTTNGNVFTSSFVNIGSRINIGAFQSTTISGNIALSFPLNEYIMVDTTSGTPTFILPNTASLATSAGCAFHIRRVAGTNGISFTSATGSQISNSTNVTVASLSGITNLNIKFMLFNKLWYFSSYA
jgi:hypothetical protein